MLVLVTKSKHFNVHLKRFIKNSVRRAFEESIREKLKLKTSRLSMANQMNLTISY